MKKNQTEIKIIDISKKIKDLENKYNNKINLVKEENNKKISISGVITEFFSGLLIGITVGYYLDDFFNLSPLFFIICSTLGIIASLYNLYRSY